MANKGLGLLLAGGAALVLMSGGKKKRKTKSSGGVYDREMYEAVKEIEKIERAKPSKKEPTKKEPTKKEPAYEVAEYQAQLHRIGYGDFVGAVDGVLGSGTRQAILEFQRDMNTLMEKEILVADGIWGPQTQKGADVIEDEILPKISYSRFPDYVNDIRRS